MDISSGSLRRATQNFSSKSPITKTCGSACLAGEALYGQQDLIYPAVSRLSMSCLSEKRQPKWPHVFLPTRISKLHLGFEEGGERP